MNAQTPTVADPAATLPDFAVGQIALLRAVAALGQCDVAALIERTGKPNGVVNRDLRKLVASRLVTDAPHALTPAGQEEIERLFLAVPMTFEGPDHDDDANPVRDAAPLPPGLTTLRHDQIHIGDKNPRKDFDPDELDDLAGDIVARGLKANLHARARAGSADTHELIAGERRWRAIGLGIERGQIPPDFAIPVLVEDMSDEAHRIAALLENIQRVDLTPLEEADVYEHLVRVEGRTTAQVAAMANKKNREYVQQRLRLTRLTDAEKARMRQGELTFSDARRLLANRAEPLALTPRQLMVLAEVLNAATPATDLPSSYTRVSFDCMAADPLSGGADPDLLALIDRGLLIVHEPCAEELQADYQLQPTSNPDTWRAVAATLPQVFSARERRAGLLALRAAVLGAQAAEDLDTEGVSACAWLNAPFVHDTAQQAIAQALRDHEAENDARRAQYAAEDAARRQAQINESGARRAAQDDEISRGPAFLADMVALEATLALEPCPIAFAPAMGDLLARHGWAPPFRVTGDPAQYRSLMLTDAAGRDVAGIDDGFQAIRRFQAMALNIALGLPPVSGLTLDMDAAPFLSDDEDDDQ